ncbi:MAG TPA: carboxypeptidase-like regulatory domain-containing protein [Pilimelia sp.]|nr:carboxypeptidase-like regulatory domain-containing protein [Pilimelia sp.]
MASLLGWTGPALADAPEVQITNLSPDTLRSGERANFQFTVANKNSNPTPFRIRVEVGEGLSCQGDCSLTRTIRPEDGPATFNAVLVAGAVPANQTRPVPVRVSVASTNPLEPGDTASAEQTVTVRGPDEAPAIRAISGQVYDLATGEPVDDATVAMRDAKGQRFDTETRSDGRWEFRSTQERPIAPGRLTIAVGKSGFSSAQKSYEVAAGQSRTGVRIGLATVASPSASPSAEPTPEPTPEPTATAGEEESPATAAAPQTVPTNETGTTSWLLIILGGLLVALGVGTIVLVLMRRRDDGAEDEPVEPTRGRAAAPAGAALAAEETRLVSRVDPGADPTMVARPDLADAPTMLHAPVRDEYADPYGVGPAPAPRGWSGGHDDSTRAYGAPSSGAPYGATPASGAPYGGAPASGAPYGGAPAAGTPYGGPGGPGFDPRGGPGAGYGEGYAGRDPGHVGRYDEPTGRFGGAAEAAPNAGGYPGDAGYPGGGGYPPDGGDYRTHGYGGPEAYGQRGYGAGAGGYPADDAPYDPRGGREPSGGYPPPGGYGRADYDQPGYGSAGGYDARSGYGAGEPYDEPGRGRHGGPPPGGRGAERRSLDWLDD